MMNYLISAYSVNPYHGSEDGVGWNWVLQYEKNYKAGDRIILLTKKYNEEEKLLISKVLDKIKFVKEKNRVEITDFLNMYEQKIVKEILNKIQEENYILYGGFEAAERKLILFYPEKLENIFQEKIPNCNQYINTVRIELPNEMHGKYVHKNYLSGLMKLGVKREKIGDIIVYKKFYDHLTVHRIQNIITLSSTRFYCETKGDNNAEEDGYKVLNSEIIGIVNRERD